MYGFLRLPSMYHQLEQAAKRKELSDREQDLQQLTAYLSDLSLRCGVRNNIAGTLAVIE